jgi:hypothetical protein
VGFVPARTTIPSQIPAAAGFSALSTQDVDNSVHEARSGSNKPVKIRCEVDLVKKQPNPFIFSGSIT